MKLSSSEWYSVVYWQLSCPFNRKTFRFKLANRWGAQSKRSTCLNHSVQSEKRVKYPLRGLIIGPEGSVYIRPGASDGNAFRNVAF